MRWKGGKKPGRMFPKITPSRCLYTCIACSLEEGKRERTVKRRGEERRGRSLSVLRLADVVHAIATTVLFLSFVCYGKRWYCVVLFCSFHEMNRISICIGSAPFQMMGEADIVLTSYTILCSTYLGRRFSSSLASTCH